MATLKELAIQWVNDEITLDEAKASSKDLVMPVKKIENNEIWYEGDEDNLVTSVYSLIDINVLTANQANIFLEAVASAH